MKQTQINKILKENKDIFDILENYDKTRDLPISKKKNKSNPLSRNYKQTKKAQAKNRKTNIKNY